MKNLVNPVNPVQKWVALVTTFLELNSPGTVRVYDLVGNVSDGISATFTISATATSSGTPVYLPIVIKNN